MESRQSLSRRRRAVENIGAVTKAMEVVAAVKMRKSQEAALGSRPYAFKVLDLLEKLSRDSLLETSFMRREPPKNTLVVLITSDRGLIGSFNTQILRTFENFLAGGNSFVAVGKKAEAFLIKKNLPVLRKFYGFGDFIKAGEIEPLSNFIVSGYERGDWDRVLTFSMHFRSALKQEALVREILPLDSRKILETVSEIIPERGRFTEFGKGNVPESGN
ncbi:MAG: FoF1 ATP synthase subunit gamma, partial [Patescibacteria group bacterium]